MKQYRLQVYRDRRGEWRWRLIAPNGKIKADGGEGYSTRSNAMRAGKRMRVVFVLYPVRFEYQETR